MSVFALAERLHMTIGPIIAMDWEEFSGWCKYFEARDKEQNPSMLDSPQNMLSGFAGFGL